MTAEEVKEAKEEKKSEKTETVEVELPELNRPLEKMTVKELREIGLLIPTMVGVHSMKKDQLVSELKQVYGIEDEVKSGPAEIRALKDMIAGLKVKKAAAIEAKDRHQIDILRRKLNRMKKKTRKMAKKAG